MTEKKDCREWFRQYAVANYGAAGDDPGVDTFAACCALAIERGNAFDVLGQYAQVSGRKEYDVWFDLRRMMQGMRVAWEVQNSVQMYQDEVWERQWEELDFGED